ncbi:MAG: hypothetical protein EZS28_015441 [Streblomastix strix]|uniref:Uncharacterized protein n=1 Tax=Streblomastix strix TaxID=222440 RepID=A0A5J4W2C2_9EUKA|nr:MAG: hypothetical protein EZS28_015441 [Streblomastix strix]
MQEQNKEDLSGHEDKKLRLSEDSKEIAVEENIISLNERVIKLLDEISQPKSENQMTDAQKHEITKQIVSQIREMNTEQIIQTFDVQQCIKLTTQFNEIKTQTEYELLDAVEIIVKCAAEHKNKEQRQKFNQIFFNSGLRKAIRKGIKNRIPKLSLEDEQDEIDDEWMWDEVVQQLARIYCYIISNSKVESNITGECGMIIDRNIFFAVSDLQDQCIDMMQFDKIKKEKNEDKDNNLDEDKDEKENYLYFLMFQLEDLLNALKYGSKQETHRLALVWLSDVYHNLEPLFHIDCPANLKCSKCITFPDSFSTEDLHLLALEVLAKCKESISLQQELYVDRENFIAHIAPVIISFAAKTSFQFKYSMTIELSSLPLIQAKCLPSEHRFVVYLNLLHSLIVNNSRYSDSIASFPNLLPVLIAFTFYNHKNREEITDVNESNTEIIREQCIEIVSEICQHCNKHIQYKVLIEMRFAYSLTLAGIIGGGGQEQNRSVIKIAKNCFTKIFRCLKRVQDNKLPYLPVRSETSEVTERQGGFEEFNSLSFGRKN